MKGEELRPGDVLGLDGEVYPARYTKQERSFIVGRCHYLSHDEGKSVRQIKRILEVEHNVKRSVGSVHSYLSDWKCDECSGSAKVGT